MTGIPGGILGIDESAHAAINASTEKSRLLPKALVFVCVLCSAQFLEKVGQESSPQQDLRYLACSTVHNRCS